ncbi:MAG: hypothetical protein Wins2KO_15960 [Winogradskyella sp.]
MDLVRLLIIAHAALGGIALISGSISMFSKKGSLLHKQTGKLFVGSMILSAAISIPVCFFPGHENMLLFSIAVFTIYCILSGQRALLFKPTNLLHLKLWKDWLISGVMFSFGIALMLEGAFKLLYPNGPTLLFYFFGILSLFFSIQDFLFFAKKNKPANEFIKRHIGLMSGAYTSSFTAFLLAGLQLKHWLVWIVPTVLITIWIIYWMRKYSKT